MEVVLPHLGNIGNDNALLVHSIWIRLRRRCIGRMMMIKLLNISRQEL